MRDAEPGRRRGWNQALRAERERLRRCGLVYALVCEAEDDRVVEGSEMAQ